MKNVKSLAIATIAGGLMFASCDLVKDIDYKVQDNPLEMHGDSVELVINGTFQEKGLHKKAVVEVTPVLIGKDGNVVATFKMEKFQGFKAADNGIVIPKEGGSFSYTSKIPYTAAMENGDLKVNVLPKKGTKTYDEIVTDKIADATIVTPLLVASDDMVIMAKDAFVRVTSHSQEAVVNYGKNQSNVKGGEMTDADIKEMGVFMTEAMANDRIELKSTSIASYASPEGEMDKNANLADERAASAKKAIASLLKRNKASVDTLDTFYTLSPKGEDWAGFKTEVEKTEHADKELILRVLEMTSDLNAREVEIKNMAQTYKFLEKEVLPQLRRSQVSLNYELTGKTDEELTALAKSNPDSLTLEEILFAATLTEELNEKLRIYKESERMFATDWRTANNVGFIQMLQNNMTDAEASFNRAAGVEETTTVKNNLGVIARLKGDRDKALALYAEAGSAGNEVAYNTGIINIQQGDYEGALANFGDYETFNKALAQVLNDDSESALRTLENSDAADTAMGYYLKAIIGARTNNLELLMNNLKSAIGKDASLKAKAASDREFIKFMTNSDFSAIVG